MAGPRIGAGAQAALLLAVTLAAGLAVQTLRSKPLPWRQNWSTAVAEAAKLSGVPIATLEQARTIVTAGSHIILDARPPADFAAGHLPGSFSAPSEQMEKYLPQVLPMLTPAQPVLTYCSGLQCDESVKLSRHLIANGFTNVVLFQGGWAAWSAAKLPVEK